MNSESEPEVPVCSKNKIDKTIELMDFSIKQAESVIDWLTTTRESLANANLELFTLFKPLETGVNVHPVPPIENISSSCPLYKDCDATIEKIISGLNNLSNQ